MSAQRTIRHGLNDYPVVSFEGRNCYTVGFHRMRRRKGWGYFNNLIVHFLDGRVEMIPAGRFNSKVKEAVPE